MPQNLLGQNKTLPQLLNRRSFHLSTYSPPSTWLLNAKTMASPRRPLSLSPPPHPKHYKSCWRCLHGTSSTSRQLPSYHSGARQQLSLQNPAIARVSSSYFLKVYFLSSSQSNLFKVQIWLCLFPASFLISLLLFSFPSFLFFLIHLPLSSFSFFYFLSLYLPLKLYFKPSS